jgi:hypothetical protein
VELQVSSSSSTSSTRTAAAQARAGQQQQHRQACLARWPGHHSTHTEIRGREGTHRRAHRGARQKGHGGHTSAQPRLWQRGHHPEAATARGAASCSRPSIALEATPGLQAAVQPMRRRRATASTEELGRKLQRGQPEQIKPQGRDPLGGARRRWRWLEARSTNPHGQGEAHSEAEQMRHRAAAELAGARRNRARNASAIQKRQRGIRVRTRPSGG